MAAVGLKQGSKIVYIKIDSGDLPNANADFFVVFVKSMAGDVTHTVDQLTDKTTLRFLFDRVSSILNIPVLDLRLIKYGVEEFNTEETLKARDISHECALVYV